MAAAYEVLRDINLANRFKDEFVLDVLIGLSETPKRIPSKHFYDAQGSRLFQAITELPEYYLTRCELKIFQHYKEEIAQMFADTPFNLVELGPGDARKTQVLMEYFLFQNMNFHYVPIDISEPAMADLIKLLKVKFPDVEVRGLVSGYTKALNWLKSLDHRRNFVLFLGSNIGNFSRAAANVFLRSLWNALNHDDLVLIGFDLKKDIDLLLRAYNDSQGVTRDFNLNLLRRINAELGGNFDLTKFRFYSNYDVYSGAIESYLVSLEKQTVFIEQIGQSFAFEAWEPIHTEYSYKYLETDIQALAATTGYVEVTRLYDPQHYFTDCVWRVQKANTNTASR